MSDYMNGIGARMGPMINTVARAVGQAARQAGGPTGGSFPQPPGLNTADLQRRVAELEAQVAALTAMITATPSGLSISVPGTLQINAGSVQFNAPLVRTAGVLQTDTLIANTVVSASYTPGAGNVW